MGVFSGKLLILDEPTSSLDEKEVGELFAVLRKIRAQGMGIVIVTHFLDQVYAISDRITVLRDGKLVGEFETAAGADHLVFFFGGNHAGTSTATN